MALDLAPQQTLPVNTRSRAPNHIPAEQRRVVTVCGRGLVPLTLVSLASVTPWVGTDITTGPGVGLLVALVGLTSFAAVTGRRGSTRLGLCLTAIVAAAALLPSHLGWWPLPGVLGVGVYVMCHVLARNRQRKHSLSLRLGRFTTSDACLVAALVLSSGVVLLAFSRFAPPQLGAGAALLADLTTESLVVVGVTFATVNAFVEEFLFRGAIMEQLGSHLGNWAAVLVQAAAFGTLHFHGYPYGLTGVVLASIYGLLLGVLRLRSGGLLAPWVAHVCADVVIFVLIVQAVT